MVWLLLSLLGCSREDFYAEQTLTQSVKNVYDDCDAGRIGFLKRKTNIQTIFSDCGSNNVYNFDWAPNGSLMYFQAYTNAFILNPENQGVDQLPIDNPSDKGVWFNDQTIIVPVTDRKSAKSALAVYHLSGKSKNYEVPGTLPKDLQRYDNQNILLTLIDESGKRVPYTFNETDGFIRVFPFLTDVNNVNAAPSANLLGYADDTGAHIVNLNGDTIADFPTVQRQPTSEGQYIALEVDGEPCHLWTRVTESMCYLIQEREENDGNNGLMVYRNGSREVAPTEIHIFNVDNKRRYRITNFFGEKFQWYEAQKYFCSFYVRGLGGQFINQNVALTDIGVALLMADNGDFPSSIELWPTSEN